MTAWILIDIGLTLVIGFFFLCMNASNNNKKVDYEPTGADVFVPFFMGAIVSTGIVLVIMGFWQLMGS